MRKIFTSDYRRALRLSLILHVVIIAFAAVDIFDLFNKRPIEALPDIALVTEADLKQIQKQIKQQPPKPIVKPKTEPETEKPLSKIASAMELIDKNIKELSKITAKPEPKPTPKPEPKPKPTPVKPVPQTKEVAKKLATPDNKKIKIDEIDLSNLQIDNSQQDEIDNSDLKELEKITQQINQDIEQQAETAVTPPKKTESEIDNQLPNSEIIEKDITEAETELEQAEIAPEEIIEETIIEEAETEEKPVSELESELSYQELLTLREQIGTCWNPPSGAKNSEDLVIRVQIELDEQAVLITARILHDFGADINDPFYRAATESALRAVYDPNCTPLKLPADKYDIWKKTILTFRPTL